jgi:hypothetical protein
LPSRVDDLGALQPLCQEADAPADLAQAPLAADVVTVLRPIAVAGRPCTVSTTLGRSTRSIL